MITSLSRIASSEAGRSEWRRRNVEHAVDQAGVKEVRAWTVRIGASAPEAAGVIHTDFEKGFIRAETISYKDFVQAGTEAKAKELRPFIEKTITHAKNGSIASRRFVVSTIGSKNMAEKLLNDIAPKYKERDGGYTRIVKLPIRKIDASKMAQIELV